MCPCFSIVGPSQIKESIFALASASALFSASCLAMWARSSCTRCWIEAPWQLAKQTSQNVFRSNHYNRPSSICLWLTVVFNSNQETLAWRMLTFATLLIHSSQRGITGHRRFNRTVQPFFEIVKLILGLIILIFKLFIYLQLTRACRSRALAWLHVQVNGLLYRNPPTIRLTLELFTTQWNPRICHHWTFSEEFCPHATNV